MIDVIGNSDNTFTFEKIWNYIFCYGRRSPRSILNKQKFMAINFVNYQEIDRQQ